MRNASLVVISTGMLLLACKESPVPAPQAMPKRATMEEQGPAAVPASRVYPRVLDAAQIARGSKLYEQHCAACHGSNAEGAAGWHKPGADGKFPPPALDGTAHAWHHPMFALKRTIREGTLALGGNMPAMKDRLSEQDIEDVIAWFQAKWPDELYQAWARTNARVLNKP